MKKLLFITLLACGTFINAQKNVYESTKFDALSKDHHVLAIIPFVTHLALEENITNEESKKLAENEGYAVQDALETYFGLGQKKKKFTVDFQNIKNTNAILAQNNISYHNIDIYTIKELAEILEADAIVSGNLDLNILLSEGIPVEFSVMDYFIGDSNYGRIGIKISDGKTGKLLWKYENEINKKSGRNTADLIDKLMKKLVRKFPYDKERLRMKKNSKPD
ncbi:MAG: hypothetical protein WBN55_02195 [Eudoraea sp.]|uniref:hypothetical protein n=1 Tax=Eudoraea sp. TaxID=1979955 RepID=UPI003C74E952